MLQLLAHPSPELGETEQEETDPRTLSHTGHCPWSSGPGRMSPGEHKVAEWGPLARHWLPAPFAQLWATRVLPLLMHTLLILQAHPPGSPPLPWDLPLGSPPGPPAALSPCSSVLPPSHNCTRPCCAPFPSTGETPIRLRGHLLTRGGSARRRGRASPWCQHQGPQQQAGGKQAGTAPPNKELRSLSTPGWERGGCDLGSAQYSQEAMVRAEQRPGCACAQAKAPSCRLPCSRSLGDPFPSALSQRLRPMPGCSSPRHRTTGPCVPRVGRVFVRLGLLSLWLYYLLSIPAASRQRP